MIRTVLSSVSPSFVPTFIEYGFCFMEYTVKCSSHILRPQKIAHDQSHRYDFGSVTCSSWLNRQKCKSNANAILHAHALDASQFICINECSEYVDSLDGGTLSKSKATMYYTTTICNVKTTCIGTIVCLSFICFRCLIVVDVFFLLLCFYIFGSVACAFHWREKIETNGTYFNRFNGLPHMHHDHGLSLAVRDTHTDSDDFLFCRFPAVQADSELWARDKKLNGLSFE